LNKKAGIQLSVNFLVLLVLAIMAFGLGVTIIYNLTGEMDTMATQMDEQTQRQLEQALAGGGTQVALPFNSKDLRRGENSQLAFGIKNTESDVEEFLIKIDCRSAYEHQHENGESFDDPITDHCGTESDDDKVAVLLGGTPTGDGWTREIEHRDRMMENMHIVVGSETKSGRYTFSLEVEKMPDGVPGTAESYGTPRRFYINVY